MNRAVKYFLSALLWVSAFVGAGAQGPLIHDLELYEQICTRCLDLKRRVDEGEQVSKSEAENTIAFFVELNRKLKAVETEMTVIQRQHFKDIGQWFTTGVKPVRPEPLPKLVCRLPETLIPHFDMVLKGYVSDMASVGNQETLQDTHEYFAIAETSVPDLSYGVRLGVMGRRLGGYVSCRSNFVFGDASYGCLSDGTLDNGGRFWPNGNDRVGNMAVTVGASWNVADPIDLYAGTGYGWRLLHWQDIDGGWAEVSDWSHRGPCMETGLIFSYRRLAFSAGLYSIGFKTLSMTAGVGVRF